MCVNNLPKVATQWNSGTPRDSNHGRRVLIPSPLTTRPLSHTRPLRSMSIIVRVVMYVHSDDDAVASGWLPGPPGVRELQAAAAGARRRRTGNPADPLPDAAIHWHRGTGLTGLCLGWCDWSDVYTGCGPDLRPGLDIHTRSQNRLHREINGQCCTDEKLTRDQIF